MEKAVLSIRVSHDFYNRLKNIVPKGQIGDFIEKATDKELIKKQSNLGSAYQECYANNPHLLKLAEQWEKAETEDWLNYERNKSDNVKKRVRK